MKKCFYCKELIGDSATKCPICNREFTYADMNAMMYKKREEDKKAKDEINVEATPKENIIGGIIGSFIGAAIGAVLWLFFSRIGFIVGLAGCAIIVFSIMLYKKMSGGLSRKGIFVCIASSVIMIYIADYISMGMDVLEAFQGEISFSEAMQILPDLMREQSVLSVFIKNLLIGYLIAGIACFSTVKRMLRSIKK